MRISSGYVALWIGTLIVAMALGCRVGNRYMCKHNNVNDNWMQEQRISMQEADFVNHGSMDDATSDTLGSSANDY